MDKETRMADLPPGQLRARYLQTVRTTYQVDTAKKANYCWLTLENRFNSARVQNDFIWWLQVKSK